MGYVQYTHCVTRDEYEVMGWESFIGPALGVVAAVVIGILTVPGVGVLVGLVAGIWAFEKVCAYLLGGKLICLAHDRCAIGRVVQIEPVGYGKDGFEEIDNDFAVNLLLAPHTTNADRATIAGDGLQGELIAQKSPETDGLDFTGYDTNHGITIPVLHTEFEGSRIRDFCDAIFAALALLFAATVFCMIPIVGWIACAIAIALGAGIAIALLLDGWFNAHDGSAKDAEVHPGDGDLHAMDPDTKEGGDYVVITGDWVYDAAHAGWTELHPAKSVQKIPHNWLEDDDPTSVQAFKDVFNRWCTLAHQADDPSVRDAQANPENEWALHPTVDGCQPAGTPPPIG